MTPRYRPLAHSLPSCLLLLAFLALLATPRPAPASDLDTTGTIKVALGTPASVVVYDNGTLRRSDTGDWFDVPIVTGPGGDERWGITLNVIPEEAGIVWPVTIRVRVENLGTPMNVPNPEHLWWWNGGLSHTPTIVDHDLGEGGAGWYEFTQTIDAAATPFVNNENRIVFLYSSGLPWFSELYVYLQVQQPHQFSVVDRDTGPLDRWYKLTKKEFPAEYTDGIAWPDDFTINQVPVVGEMVEIGGEGVRYDPATVTTDSEGEFGVLAFVDPATFQAKHDANEKLLEPAKASTAASLRLKYKKLITDQGITGNFCEVIMVEGTVRVVGGSGTVSVGDILYPGQTLSLGASWGKRAMLGLRFVNGADASVMQDVFTNACIADMIVIGSSGIENTSVIQGNTPLMTVARTLCEKVAGLPDTPEEWATAAGRVVVTGAASSVVPGSGIVAYAIKYTVKTAAGKTYDHVVNSGSGGKAEKAGDGPARVDIGVYYDGSTRLVHNYANPFQVMSSGQSAPFATIGAGQWQEVVDTADTGRLFTQTLATIDSEGPQVRYAPQYFSTANPSWTRLDIRAFDPAGIDPTSLRVVLDGSDVTSSFQQLDPSTWRAEFFGGAASVAPVEITLADTIGNQTTYTWSTDVRPGPPVITTALAGHRGGDAFLDWTPPAGMEADDVLYYEVSLTDCPTTSCDTTWRSVGNDSQASIPVPDPTLNPGMTYRLSVRACDREGRTGPAATSDALTIAPAPSAWSIY